MPKIMVVDDEEQVRVVIREHLLMRDFAVVEAGDGLEALELLAAGGVDLVITDINMPRADGFYLLAQAKINFPTLPIIIMTGRPSIQAAVQCVKTGAVDFLTKPLDFAKLAELITSTLARLKSGEDLIKSPPASQKIRTIAGYNIVRTIGTGTYGMVFQAKRKVNGLDETVALKILRGGEFGSKPTDEALKRFEREATCAATISHPNVVRIVGHGWADEEEIPYLAMEFVEGSTLKDLIIAGHSKWDYHTKAKMVRQLAAAVNAIHLSDLCHRDIKSQNVMVTPDLTCKITDFGIVKQPDSQLTMPDRLVGTPAYMAPEAFFSANTDARADLFSLGVVAYELFCGCLPFAGETVTALMMSVTKHRPPDPRGFDPDFPKALQFILARLLKKSPDERYPTANALISDLDEYLAGTWEPRVGLLSIFRTVNLARDWA
jgi:serine/threonine protein kinase/CheY-like chemotaxis protein